MAKLVTGTGRKRLQRNIPVDGIFLDPENPRLREDDQGKDEKNLLRILHRDFSLRELAESFAQNGYFDEEPIVVTPKNLPDKYKNKNYEELNQDKGYIDFINDTKTIFTVIEGNRKPHQSHLYFFGGVRHHKSDTTVFYRISNRKLNVAPSK